MSRPIDRERWRRLSPILDSALGLPAEALSAHLDEACAGDADLRREVEDLLAAEASGGAFLAGSALERAAPLVAEVVAGEPFPPAAADRRAGAYRLIAEL